MTTDLRDIDISQLTFAQLRELAQRINERCDVIRQDFIAQAAELGIACDPRNAKRKPRRTSHRNDQHKE